MHHAITIGGLLAFCTALAGVIVFAVGMLMFFAGAMSDAPAAGDAAGKQGCIVALIGIALFVIGLWRLFQ